MKCKIILVVTIFTAIKATAQHNSGTTLFNCPSDELRQKYAEVNAVYKTQLENFEKKYITIASQKQLNTNEEVTVYNIPVVVHIIHSGEAVGTPNNPDDNTIISNIQAASNRFRHTSGLSFPSNPYSGADAGIQLCIAQSDPFGRLANGILRYNNPEMANPVSFNGMSTYLAGISWPKEKYCNIFIITYPPPDLQFSGVYASVFDGTVYMSSIFWDGLICHELGHYFNLGHTFDGSCVNNNCLNDGDKVCDTPPKNAAGGSQCNNPGNSCITDVNDATTNNPFRPVATGGIGDRQDGLENYMDYTGPCWAAFTQGQALRMRTLIETNRNMMVSTSTCTVAATPQINFEVSQSVVAENNSNQSASCRKYRDYDFKLIIGGNGPSTDAIVALITTGSAIEKIDYDITANGNFISPGRQVLFPANETSEKIFTIRIYNDATVDGTDSIKIGFTFTSNGGNAFKGSYHPELTLFINDDDFHPVAATGNPTIGNITISVFGPFNNHTHGKSQILYTAAELKNAGMSAGSITAISLNMLYGTNNYTYKNVKIKMLNTTVSVLPLSNDADIPIFFAGDYIIKTGWNLFSFSSPFAWDGSSNILVGICYENADSSGGHDFGGYTTIPANVIHYSQSNISCEANTLPYNETLGTKPSIRFSYTSTGTLVQTAISSAKTEYLGPSANVYFYDSIQNQLIARITNLTSFDYGCTTVEIDRAGNSSAPFLTTNLSQHLLSKTLKVTPEYNNPEGVYLLTLYYTADEVNGWQTATGNSFTNLQLVKVENQISQTTPTNQPGGGKLEINTSVIRNTLGTNYSAAAVFRSGFSGFGAGIVINNPYYFTGNGDYNNGANWANGSAPPNPVPAGTEIILDPPANGECNINTPVIFEIGTKITIKPGKKINVAADVIIK